MKIKLNSKGKILAVRTKIQIPTLDEVVTFGQSKTNAEYLRSLKGINFENLSEGYRDAISERIDTNERIADANRITSFLAIGLALILIGTEIYYKNSLKNVSSPDLNYETKAIPVHYYEPDTNRVNNPELKRKDLTLYLDN